MRKYVLVLLLVLISSCYVFRKTVYLDVKKETFYPFLSEYQSLIDEQDSVKVYDMLLAEFFTIPNKYLYYSYTVGTWAPSDWVRNADNIWGIHNSLMKIGYTNFIPREHYFLKWHTGNDYSLSAEIDSFYYARLTELPDTANYYYKFWKRREAEGNAEVLGVVLDEIKQIYESEFEPGFDQAAINDTVYTLLNYEYLTNVGKYSNEQVFVNGYFNYLKTLGLEQSAYHLVNFTRRFGEAKLNRDSMNLTLDLDTISSETWLSQYGSGKGYWIYKQNGG